MLYTSYFTNLNKFPKSYIPVAICRSVPDWFDGIWYEKLAASSHTVFNYKSGNIDEDYYTKQYTEEVLDKLNPLETYNELMELCRNAAGSDKFSIVLLCYEKSNKFCHRSIVSNWFRKSGIACIEWKSWMGVIH